MPIFQRVFVLPFVYRPIDPGLPAVTRLHIVFPRASIFGPICMLEYALAVGLTVDEVPKVDVPFVINESPFAIALVIFPESFEDRAVYPDLSPEPMTHSELELAFVSGLVFEPVRTQERVLLVFGDEVCFRKWGQAFFLDHFLHYRVDLIHLLSDCRNRRFRGMLRNARVFIHQAHIRQQFLFLYLCEGESSYIFILIGTALVSHSRFNFSI